MKLLKILILICGFLMLGSFLDLSSYAALTSNTQTSGTLGTGAGFWKQNILVDSATDVTCIDARGYTLIFINVVKTAGDIDVDLDRSLDATDANPISVVDGIVADGARSEVVIAPYYCMDIDTCTNCTVTTTFYLWTPF